jgi:hypothetical protein
MTRVSAFASAVALIAASCAAIEELVPGAPLPVRTHEGLSYRAETVSLQAPARSYETTATLTNTTTSRRTVTFPDGCVVLVRAYRNAARAGAPAWDQARTVACTQALVEVAVAPGETVSRNTRFEPRAVLGDSLPEGRYYLSAYLRPMNTVVEVAAGEVDLQR